jgi:hypothetical protein
MGQHATRQFSQLMEDINETKLNSAKLVPTFLDRGCHVVNATDPEGHILAFLGQSRYFFFQVVPQLNS